LGLVIYWTTSWITNSTVRLDKKSIFACYFAVEEEYDGDSVIYAYYNSNHIFIDDYSSPFECKEVGRFYPRHITPRITVQGALFTVHPNPYEKLESENIDKIRIPKGIRRGLKKTLNLYGINRYSLFPGLDGLAKHIQWLRSMEH
jgi:type I restriction enzyme M protein